MIAQRRSASGGGWLRWIVVLVALGVMVGSLQAGTGDEQHLPALPMSKLRSKLRLTIDLRWVDGTGYRPVIVEAIPTPGPAAVDRQIRVTFQPMGDSQREISTLIDIPQGSRSVQKEMLLPQYEIWYNLRITVSENGKEIEELSGQYLNFMRTNYWEWTEASPALLFIDSDVPAKAVRSTRVTQFLATATDPNLTYNLPDFRNLVRTFPESPFPGIWVPADGSQKVGDTELLSQLRDTARAEMLPPAEIPDRWLALTSFDIAFISMGDLEKFAAEQPERFRALLQWLRAGAVLCVYDVGAQYERLADLETQLKLAPRPQSQKDKKYRGWTPPNLKKRFASLPQTLFQRDYAVNSGQVDPASDDSDDFSAGKPAPETWPYIVRDAGLGYVVAMEAENPFPGEPQYWTWLLQTIPNEHWKWYRRHGMSLHRENSDFWNFLIPGVGVAPVFSFLLLITLFAAVIGPVNYIVLGRWRRLYLLLITVPLGAAVVTASLFLYALATDGVGVRSRIRSFTELDPRAGEAISWSRQSYYASIAPSDGLRFPDDAAIYPLAHQPTGRGGPHWMGQRLNWDDGQHLAAGYLPSRSATQFLVVRATPSKSRLVVQPRTDGGPPRVTNELGCAVHYLVIADQRTTDADKPRTYWYLENLAPGATAQAKPIELGDAQASLNSIYRENALEFPENYDRMSHSTAAEFLFGGYHRYVSVDPAHDSASVATSVLERNLLRLARRDDGMLEPGAFLAVTDSPPEMPLGVAGVRQERSLHVVHGRWSDK